MRSGVAILEEIVSQGTSFDALAREIL
jgi:hypothetical protein